MHAIFRPKVAPVHRMCSWKVRSVQSRARFAILTSRLMEESSTEDYCSVVFPAAQRGLGYGLWAGCLGLMDFGMAGALGRWIWNGWSLVGNAVAAEAWSLKVLPFLSSCSVNFCLLFLTSFQLAFPSSPSSLPSATLWHSRQGKGLLR